MLSSCTLLPDSKETKLGSSNQEASSSAGKNTGVDIVPCHAWKFVLTAIFGVVDISKVPGFLFITTDDFTVRVTKIISRIVVSRPCSIPFRFLPLLDSMKWPYQKRVNQTESHNSLKLSYTNIWALHSNFVGSFFELTLLIFLLFVRQTWKTQVILVTFGWGVIFL